MPPKKVKLHLQSVSEKALTEKKRRAELQKTKEDLQRALDQARNEIAQLHQEIDRLNEKVYRANKAKERYKNETKKIKRTLDKSRKLSRDLYVKAWKLQHRRDHWKDKRVPSKRNSKKPRKTVLNAEIDVLFTVQFGITGSSRKKMKSFMRQNKVDFFAKDIERDALIREICPNELWIYEEPIKKKGVLFVDNIFTELWSRLEVLVKNGKLKLRDDSNEVHVCLIGDTGANLTKIGFFFLDVPHANDPRNLSLISIYEGTDSAELLRLYCADIFYQLLDVMRSRKQIEISEGITKTLSLKFVLAGDMVFLLNVYGLPNLWSSNEFCLFCDISKKHPNSPTNARTLESMLIAFRSGHHMQKHCPVVTIEPSDVVPSTLHTILGVATDFFKRIEEIAKKIDEASQTEIFDQIQEILAKNRIDKQAYFMTFTGNQIHKLLATDDILKEIGNLFKEQQEYCSVEYHIEVLKAVGKVQRCGLAKFLNEEEKNQLRKSIQELKDRIYQVDNPRITPKLHWILEHVAEFADRHGYWGLSSEQGIEHLHKDINEDLRHFAAIRNRKEKFRQVAKMQKLRNYFFDNKP